MLPYVPSLPPHYDFAIAVGLGRESEFPSFQTTHVGGALLLRPAEQPSQPGEAAVHFSGFAFRDGCLVTCKTAHTRSWNAETHDGNYVVVTRDASGLLVNTDVFGLGILYLYRARDGSGSALLSNNLHMLVALCKLAGLRLHASRPAFLKRLLAYNFGQQVSGFTTFYEEVEMLPVDRCVRISKADIRTEEKPRTTYASYADAVEAGVEAMRNQVRAAAGFAHIVALRLSGGYDSRAIFGALVREDLLRRVWCWTFPERTDDFRIAKLLVNHFGGDFSDGFPWHRNTVALSLEDAYSMWASQNFGLYSSHLNVEAHARTSFDRKWVIVLNGGGGECFRDFYMEYFPELDPERPGVLERRMAALVNFRHPDLGKSAREIVAIFCEDIRVLPGRNVLEKLRLHYLNFRNRLHFGNVTISKNNRFNISPMMQHAFLEAADYRRKKNLPLKQILFDVLLSYDKLLPLIPFDEGHKDFDSELGEPDLRLKKDLLSRLDQLNDSYDPLKIGCSSEPPAYRTLALRQKLEGEFRQAVAYINDRGVYRDIDFENYIEGIRGLRQRNANAYARYRVSVISTAHILSYAE